MLTPDDTQRLAELFDLIGWPIKKAGEDTILFRDFSMLLEELDSDERELLFDITPDFFVHSLGEYDASAEELAGQLAKVIPSKSLIVLLPLVNPHDVGETKSHVLAQYPLKRELRKLAPANKWTVQSWDRFELVTENLPTRTNAYILLADDFIGSGLTATHAIADFTANYAVPTDTIVVVAMVAQDGALNALKAAKVACIVNHARKKGITDCIRISDKLAALAMMDGIESRLKVRPLDRRGFGQSEALVSMARCPNNTFPMYWVRAKRGGEKWPSPFFR